MSANVTMDQFFGRKFLSTARGLHCWATNPPSLNKAQGSGLAEKPTRSRLRTATKKR
jgi:hypothetical protein